MMSISHNFNFESKTFFIKTPERFDLQVHPEIREITDNIPPAAKFIVFEMENTVYIDSTALGMLLILRKTAIPNMQTISITNVTPYVKKALDVAQFGDLFTIT